MNGDTLTLAAIAALALAGAATRRGSRAPTADTDTDAFRRWFGDSKVVESDGSPRMVFHGTDVDEPFEAFDPELFGQKQGGQIDGFYFASRAATADAYRPDEFVIRPQFAEKWKAMHDEEARLKPKIIAAWNAHYGTSYTGKERSYGWDINDLKDAQGQWVLFDHELPPQIRQLKAEFDQIKKAIWAGYEDQERFAGPRFWTKKKGGQRIMAYLSLQEPLIIDAGGAAWSRDFEDRLRAELRDRGTLLYQDHDGLILRNFYDGEVGLRDDVYVAFRPEQIKAVGNRGTWDPDDPRISFNFEQDDAAKDRQIRLQVARDYPEKLLANLHKGGVIPRSYLKQIPGYRPGQHYVTIYRGVPAGVTEIRRGDWVGLTASYAALHDRGGGVISRSVPATHVLFAGTDLNEWFYTPPL